MHLENKERKGKSGSAGHFSYFLNNYFWLNEITSFKSYVKIYAFIYLQTTGKHYSFILW
jgi:hypothetical protein